MPEGPIDFATPADLFDAVAPPTVATAMLLVNDAVRAGQLELGLGLLKVIRRRFGFEPATQLVEVSLLARTGEFAQAQRLILEARSQNEGFLIPQLYEAQLMLGLGLRDKAICMLRDVVARCPDYPGLAGTLAATMLPGPGYREVLASLHRLVAPRAYLEIGVETGATLSLSQARCSVGVDPNFGPLRRDRLSSSFKLFEQTSSEFFAQHRSDDVFDKTPLDLVFIDGLHCFEAAVADFAAVERWAHERTVVVMHDALPIAPVYARSQRSTRFWVGDVWKAVSLLLAERPELRLRIIATPPSGLVVITQIKPQAVQVPDWYEGALATLRAVELSDQVPPWPSVFPVVTNDFSGYREALGV